MQETRVRSLSWEDPAGHGAAQSTSCNYCVLESPGAAGTEAPTPQSPRRDETPEPLGQSTPCLLQLEKRPPGKADPAQPTINKLFLKKKRREEQQRWKVEKVTQRGRQRTVRGERLGRPETDAQTRSTAAADAGRTEEPERCV